MGSPILSQVVGRNKDNDELESPQVVVNGNNGQKGLIVDVDMLKSTFTAEYATSQTTLAIITPAEGYRLCIRTIEITTDATTGTISLDFATSSKKAARLYAAAQNQSSSNTAHLVGAINEPLTLNTTTGAKNVFLVITYVEHL